jgi:glyoxylase-like metal-dependent hydrolase (beta-lactamase superfamily II)
MNCYLVQEDDCLTLIDSTTSSPADDIASIVRQVGEALRRVTLTHAHGDHVGGVAGVRSRFPGIEVSISERDAPILAGDKSLSRSSRHPATRPDMCPSWTSAIEA